MRVSYVYPRRGGPGPGGVTTESRLLVRGAEGCFRGIVVLTSRLNYSGVLMAPK